MFVSRQFFYVLNLSVSQCISMTLYGVLTWLLKTNIPLLSPRASIIGGISSRAGKGKMKSQTGLLTIYMENPEIPVGKSNGTHHSVRSTSEIMGFWSK